MGMMTLGLEIGCLIPLALLLVVMPQRLYVLAAGVQTPVGWQVLNAVTSLGSGVVVVAFSLMAPLLSAGTPAGHSYLGAPGSGLDTTPSRRGGRNYAVTTGRSLAPRQTACPR